MAATNLACGLAVAAGVLVSIGWVVTPIVSFGLGWIGLGYAICTDRSHDVSHSYYYVYSDFSVVQLGAHNGVVVGSKWTPAIRI